MRSGGGWAGSYSGSVWCSAWINGRVVNVLHVGVHTRGIGLRLVVAILVGGLSVFFFSSRRRHTRLQGDWSSDVCSSDLVGRRARGRRRGANGAHAAEPHPGDRSREPARGGGARGGERAPLGCGGAPRAVRSEEGRVGKEGGSRGGPVLLKKKRR